MVGDRKRRRGEEQAARQSGAERVRDGHRGEEHRRNQIPAAERPPAVPVGIARHRDEQDHRAADEEPPVRAPLPRPPPSDRARNRPQQKRREHQHAARGVEEVVRRELRRRKPESEASLLDELRIARVGLQGRGQRQRRAEADGVVGEQRGERDQGRQAERRGPAQGPAGHDAQREEQRDRRHRVFRDGRERREQARSGRGEARPPRPGGLGGANQVPGQEEESGRPRVAEEGARVEEIRRPHAHGERHERRDPGRRGDLRHAPREAPQRAGADQRDREKPHQPEDRVRGREARHREPEAQHAGRPDTPRTRGPGALFE